MFSFKKFMQEGDVIQFRRKESNHTVVHPNSAEVSNLKTKLGEHEQLEYDLHSQMQKTPNDHHAIKRAAEPLLDHLSRNYGMTLMKPLRGGRQDVGTEALNLSKGIRQAENEGLNLRRPNGSPHRNYGVYSNAENSGLFDDGYGENTGLAIKAGSSHHDIAQILKKHLHK